MFEMTEGLPPNVTAIEASGKITHEDYRDTLIPRAEAMMAKGPVGLLYILGESFTGFEPEAPWDDGVFGVKHWYEFSHIAVVTAHTWPSAIVNMFKPFLGIARIAVPEDVANAVRTGRAPY